MMINDEYIKVKLPEKGGGPVYWMTGCLLLVILFTGDLFSSGVASLAGLLLLLAGVFLVGRVQRALIIALLFLAGIFIIGVLVAIPNLLRYKGEILYLVGKDIWYYSKPIVYIGAGYFAHRMGWKYHQLVALFIIVATAISIMNLIRLFTGVNFSEMDLDEIRYRFGSGNIMAAISLAYLIHMKRYRIIIGGIAFQRWIFIVILSAGIALSFSRTIVGVLGISLLAYNAYFSFKFRKLTTALFKLSIVFLFMVLMLFTLNYGFGSDSIVGQFLSKYRRSLSEISSSSEFETAREKALNWRGYESRLVRDEIRSAGPIRGIFGFGFGKTVYIGKGGFLGPDLFDIPKFHNGYSEIRLKTGMTGLILYLSFFAYLFVMADRFRDDDVSSALLKGLLVSTLFATLIITGFYNKTVLDPVALMIGFLIAELTIVKDHFLEANNSNGGEA